MKTLLKWTALVVVTAGAIAFGAFLYFIPPFFVVAPETFSKPVADAAPPVPAMGDPAERAIAEHGREIVVHTGCIGCHATNGSQGPDYSKYLAGGSIRFQTTRGTMVSRNLTPDKETGLSRRTDEEIARVLTSGVFPDGHVTAYTAMPWASFSNWTEEDRRAVIVYLRHLPPVRHQIPDVDSSRLVTIPGAIEQAYGAKDYGTSPAQ